MTIFDERKFDGQFAEGGGTGWLDVYEAAKRTAWYVDNVNARDVGYTEAYDRRIQDIKGAIGIDLENPMRRAKRGDFGHEELVDTEEDHHLTFSRELRSLAERYPDHVGVIRPERSPIEDARDKARQTAEYADQVSARYRGATGTAWTASFAGGFVGQLSDPVTYTTMLLGPWGRAAAGWRGVLWMGAKQGAANAAVEAGMQPAVAAWRTEAGLGYSFGDFAQNVGGAFAFGAGVDIGVRGVSRGIRAYRGDVPILDERGNVAGWQSREDALEAAARQSKSETLRRAADGDVDALRTVAEKAGVLSDPQMRSMMDLLENAEITDRVRAGVAPNEHHAAVLQATRALHDPLEPPPVAPRPVGRDLGPSLAEGQAPEVAPGATLDMAGRPVLREVDRADQVGHAIVFEAADGRRDVLDGAGTGGRWIFREEDGWTRADVELHAARRALHEGREDVLGAALLMREYPEAVDGRLNLASDHMRVARALSQLDERAFDQVATGAADPNLGALVALLVPNATDHAGVLARLSELQPATLDDARRAIGVLMPREGSRTAPVDIGIDDVGGAEGALQIAELEKLLRDEVAQARGQDLGAEKVATTPADRLAKDALSETPEASLAASLAEVDAIEKMALIIEVCKL